MKSGGHCVIGYYHKGLLKPSQFEVIENAGHLWMYEKPVEVNSIIQAYLSTTYRARKTATNIQAGKRKGGASNKIEKPGIG